MMTEPERESQDVNASEEQAISHTEANDSESIRERLPKDVRERLTKRAFSGGALRKLLRDTYYMGPIGIGRGGWIGAFGNGQPGTELRRPGGALYEFPRSWRYAALERALNSALITHVGGGRFVATERGLAVLKRIDVCPDCGKQREPGVRSTYYVGNPNKEGHVESHRLVTYCPDCGGNGYDHDFQASSVSKYERDDEHVERATDILADVPEARTYGDDRGVSEGAAERVPDVSEDATEELLDDVVENQKIPDAREQFSARDEGLYGRSVVSIPGEGEHYRFRGTAESIAVSKSDSEGDIHITREGEDTLKVGMSYEVAVEKNAKDAVSYHEGAEWTGNYWTIEADKLARSVSKLTAGFSAETRSGVAWFPDSDDAPEDGVEFFTVTVTEDALDAVTVPMVGVEADGELT